MRVVEFTIYSAGTQGKMIKTEDTEFSRLNTGLILNATLYNNMMRISTIVSVAGNLCTFKVGGQL